MTTPINYVLAFSVSNINSLIMSHFRFCITTSMIYVAEDLAGPKATSDCAAVLTDAVPWTVTWMGMF